MSEEQVIKRGNEPLMIRIRPDTFHGESVTRCDVMVFHREGQTQDDINRATAAIVHAQELLTALEALATDVNDGTLDDADQLIAQIKDYWE